MVVIDGKAVSRSVRERVKQETAELKAKGITPGLAVIVVGGLEGGGGPAPCDSIQVLPRFGNRPAAGDHIDPVQIGQASAAVDGIAGAGL